MSTADHPQVPVVVLTTYTDDERVFAALRAGARGFLTKDAGASEIEEAIRSAARGQAALDAASSSGCWRRSWSGAALGLPPDPGPGPVPVPVPATRPDALTAREAEVVQLIAQGHSNTEIAARLYVSVATVKTHINHVFAKTGLRDRAQLVTYAYRTGIAELPRG